MKRKFLSVLAAVVLVLSFSLVTAVPVAAQTTHTVGTGKMYTTIQAAVDNATAGDTIEVYPGDYAEDLDISKSLTLTGVTDAGANNWTALTAGDGAATVNITYDGSTAHMIKIDADDVTIQGFTIDMVNTSAVRGIYHTASGTADNSTIRYNHFSLGAGDADRAINVSDDTVLTNLTVTYNTFTGTSWGNWIAIDSNAGISGTNLFSYNVIQGTSQLTAWLEIGSRDIEDITFDHNNLNYAINIGHLTGNGEYGDLVVTNNTFAGDPSENAVDILSNVEKARFEGGAFDATDLIVNYNDFSGYLSTGSETIRNGINDSPADDIDARYNWWGSANGPTVSSNTFNVGSQGADVGADVTYWPWYDASMTGDSFSPVKNTTQSTEFSSIQAAIDDAATTTGDTITAVSGNYTEDLLINEAITLTGRNLADDANAWTVGTAGAAAAAPNIIYDGSTHTFISITSDDVTIQGFKIDGDTDDTANWAIIWTEDGSTTDNTTIQYNSLVADNGDPSIAIVGNITVTNFTITYNAFTIATGWGNWFKVALDGGCHTNNVLSYNSVVGQLTSLLSLRDARDIEDITYSNNDLDYGIWLDEEEATSTYQFGDIVLVANTFAGAPSTAAFEVLASVEDDDWEGDSLTADDVIIYYNDFTGYAVGGSATVQVATTAAANIDARYNYWGTALDGPYHATDNPYGTGGDVDADDVDYKPWLYKTLATTGDTVAEIYANQVPAYANAVDLSTGWNTFSVPIGLDGQYNTWAELYTLTSANYSLAYRFNPTTQEFESLATTDTDAVAPGEGFYIKMNEADSLPYCYSTVFSIPTRSLSADWNLIGGGLTDKDEDETCISIATAGGTAGYSHIVSPAENAAGSWVYIAGATGGTKDIVLGEGYWVFLPIARTLGLFDPTPVSWVALP